MSDREDVEALADKLGPCTQCGKSFNDRACGIAHGIIASDPLRHRLLSPLLAARDEEVRAEALATVDALADEFESVTAEDAGYDMGFVNGLCDAAIRLRAAIHPDGAN